jgi:hypothetical protein
VAGLALIALAPIACRKPITAEIERPFDLHVGQGARFRNGDLELWFRRVASDSRCPRGAQCVTAGEAMITLDGRIMKGPPESFEVGIGSGASSDDSTARRAYDGYRIQLLRLEPYPEVGRAVDSTAYVATLRVERR